MNTFHKYSGPAQNVMLIPIPPQRVTFRYKNYKGENRTRCVLVQSLQLLPLHHVYHPGQWCLFGFCEDKQSMRTFALRDILSAVELVS